MRMLTLVLAVLALSAFIGCQSKPMVGSDGQPGQGGIKISGDWTVEVRNPDGSLDSRRTFKNEWYGHHTLAALLSEDVKVDARYFALMFVDVIDQTFPTDQSGCELPQANPLPSSHSQPDWIWVDASVMRKRHTSDSSDYLTQSVWTGSCQVAFGTWSPETPKSLIAVHTMLSFDKALEGMSPVYGNTHTWEEDDVWGLSDKSFDTPVEVVNGQEIAVTVILSSGHN